ncbi:MAG: helix-turn-helix domain-containing protein [Oscillospiraceae bacterium]|nr:helix-turn-helix domain-containing protein [Oscillospiraceae bacterium]
MVYKAEEIGKRIREERLKLGLTQSELGEILFVKGKQISNYENGRLFVPVEMLVNMCKLFDCEMGYLLCEPEYSDGTRLETKIIESTGLTEESLASIRKITGVGEEYIGFRRLSEDYRRIFNRLLSSEELISIIISLQDLDDRYAVMNGREWERAEEKIGKERLNCAYKNYTSEIDFEHDEEAPQLTDEEAADYRLFDELIDKQRNAEYSVKVLRYELWEEFNSLLNELYPQK